MTYDIKYIIVHSGEVAKDEYSNIDYKLTYSFDNAGNLTVIEGPEIHIYNAREWKKLDIIEEDDN